MNVYEAGKIPLIQIHDELALSVSGREEAEAIAKQMEQAIELEVPNRCDVEIGANWGSAA